MPGLYFLVGKKIRRLGASSFRMQPEVVNLCANAAVLVQGTPPMVRCAVSLPLDEFREVAPADTADAWTRGAAQDVVRGHSLVQLVRALAALARDEELPVSCQLLTATAERLTEVLAQGERRGKEHPPARLAEVRATSRPARRGATAPPRVLLPLG